MVNRRVQNAVLGCNLKSNRMISVHFQGKQFNITVIQAYPPSVMLKKLKLNGLWRPKRPSRTNTPKRCPFHYRAQECKSRKSRNSNRQIWPWSTEWSRAKANRVLPRECTGHSKHQQHKRRLYTWTSPDGQHQNQIDYDLMTEQGRETIDHDMHLRIEEKR